MLLILSAINMCFYCHLFIVGFNAFVFQSRSEVLQIIYIVIALRMVLGMKIPKFLAIAFLFMIMAFAALLSFLQGRVTVDAALLFTIETFFRYKLSSFQLAEYSLALKFDETNILYPMVGFLYEKLVGIYYNLPNPLVSQGGSFFGDFKPVPLTGYANVLYPHWSWFVGAFGPLGLLIKGMFYLVFLAVVRRLKLNLTFVLLTMYIIFVQSWRHPFATTTDFYSFLGIIIFDTLIFIWYRYDFRVRKPT
ncbi:hypothetical protein JCM19233_3364 [Vibrio astriarenae]|nr:hypothetical protein JCM19233_3364 [Vibrio sp. C7]